MSRRRRQGSKLATKYRKGPTAKGSARKRKIRRRARRNAAESSFRPNPSGTNWSELGETVAYGFGGFAAGRFTTRVFATQAAKRWPTYAKHAGVIGGVAAFLAAVFLAKRWKQTAAHAETLQLGTGLALAQTVVQTYFPALGWVVADCSDPAQLAQPVKTADLPAPASAGLLPDDDEEGDDGWYSYNDAYDHGRHAKDARPRPSQQRPQAPPAPQPTNATTATGPETDDDDVDSILAELDDENTGIFAN